MLSGQVSRTTLPAASAALRRIPELIAPLTKLCKYAHVSTGAEHEESTAEVTVNGRNVSVPGTASVLEACHAAGVSVPTLCKDPRLPTTPGTCRLCLVDVGGSLKPACATPVWDGMAIATDTTETRKNIKSVLSLLRANHPNGCMTCEANGRCEFQDLLNRYQVEDVRPKLDHLRRRETSTGGPAAEAARLKDSSSLAVELDTEKCLKCGRCVTACSAIQDMNILGFLNRGRDRHPGVFSETPLEVTKCIECGQCTAVCPVAAVHERVEWREVMEKLESRTKVMVVQTAPAVRVAIGEEMGLAPGSITTGQMVAAQRELGFDYVFDTNFGADLTILEEGTELLARLQHKWALQVAGPAEQAAAEGKAGPLPMFTSCCPAWINACEKSYPEILPLLSSCKSPHMMLGSVAKQVWARRRGLDPADVCVVSVMPCTAKKHEADRPQMSHNGVRDVDHVITTREFGRMLRHRRLPLASLPASDFDDPLGRSTGAAALFGASGGVMEAAIRTVYELASGREMPRLDLHEVRGMAGVKSATVTWQEAASNRERHVRVAVASGIKNAKRILQDILSGRAEYDFIEVMACPGGCVGGGGQPKTKAPTAVLDRLHAIYSVDQGMPLRKSHENPSVQKLYRQELGCAGSRLSRTLLHTTYDDKSHITMPPRSAWGS